MRLGGAIVRQDLGVQDSKRVRQRDGAGLRVAYGLVRAHRASSERSGEDRRER